jgi:hypothetical protein
MENQNLEESSHCLIKVLSQNLPGGTEENHKIVRIAGVLAKIQTERLPNIRLQHYL